MNGRVCENWKLCTVQEAPAVLRRRVAPDIAGLLEADGPDFVRTAYLTLLGRKPDSSGRESAEDFLRRGGRKIDLAWSLAQSEEGRGLAVEVPGLASAFRRRALGRLPLVGMLVRPLLGLEPIGSVHRRERAITFAVAKLHETIATRLHRVANQLEAEARANEFGLDHNASPDAGRSTVRSRNIMRSLQARLA
jgi:hypothetical protein